MKVATAVQDDEILGSYDYRVIKDNEKGHFGKHESGEESGWKWWTDAGKARVEAERLEKIVNESKNKTAQPETAEATTK
jgi:hypothetical protein